MSERDSQTARGTHSYWRSVALSGEVDGDGLRPTARDPYLQEVVESAMTRWLYPEARVLDVGCGDGATTLRFAALTHAVVGIDFVSEFVDKAARSARIHAKDSAAFAHADVLDLEPVVTQYGLFDIVTTIRCLINLPTWHQQAIALGQLALCTRSGGLYLASEGWLEGFDGLNLRRQRAGLPRMEVVTHNQLISRRAFESEVSKYFDIIHYIGVGFYLFISRVLQPLLVAPDKPSHTHDLNRVASLLQGLCFDDSSFHDCDYAGVYVLRRKRR